MSRADRTAAGSGASEEFWEQHYRQRTGMGSGGVNPILVEVAANLAPGSALDLGCGEGSDALWLAGQGWRVTAVDVSATVLARVSARADAAGVGARVHPQRHDLSVSLPDETFDLVSAQYLQSPVDFDRQRVLRRAAASVAAGGVLLVVDHGSVAPWSWADPDTRFPTPEELLDSFGLNLGDWRTLRLDAPQRTAAGPGGQSTVVTDTVVALTRPD